MLPVFGLISVRQSIRHLPRFSCKPDSEVVASYGRVLDEAPQYHAVRVLLIATKCRTFSYRLVIGAYIICERTPLAIRSGAADAEGVPRLDYLTLDYQVGGKIATYPS
jgi:hypothetical protein